MLPDFLIIGAARSGTSWLAKNVMAHPDIYLPAQKELHFFDRHFDKGVAFYENYFIDTLEEQVCGEATPAYLYFEHIPKLIKETVPNVKLIAILRNPVDRAYSHYLNIQARMRSNNKDAMISFEEKLSNTPRLIEEGFYYDMLSRYFELFPASQICILISEEVFSEPKSYLKKVYNYLGVEEHYNSHLLEQKVNAASTKLGQSRFLYFIYRIVMKKLKWYSAAKKINKINKTQMPTMKEETRDYLNSIYIEKNKLLENLINRQIKCWN